MTPEIADTVVTDFLKTLSQKLDEAVQVAKAAEACANAGNPRKAVRDHHGRRAADVRRQHAAERRVFAQAAFQVRAELRLARAGPPHGAGFCDAIRRGSWMLTTPTR